MRKYAVLCHIQQANTIKAIIILKTIFVFIISFHDSIFKEPIFAIDPKFRITRIKVYNIKIGP